MRKIKSIIVAGLIGLTVLACHGTLHAKTCTHTFYGSYVETKKATCTSDGKKVGYCTQCGDVVTSYTVPKLGHSYGSWKVTKKATCTENGTEKRTCTRSGCTAYQTRTISAVGHSFNGVYKITKEATCTSAGKKVGYCTKCGDVATTYEIPKLGHSYGSWKVTKKATCTENGTEKRTCTRSGCSAYETRTISAVGHSFGGVYVVTKEATCKSTGKKVGYCTKCGDVVTTYEIPKTGHSYGDWKVTKKATCTENGTEKRTCTTSGCTAYETRTISAVGHSFGGVYTVIKEATCTSTGKKVGYCTKCGDVATTYEIPKLGHSYGDWKVTKKATCTENGTEKRTCTRSGCTAYETRTVSAVGHSFNGAYVVTKQPTCYMEGQKVGYCTKCGDVVTTCTIPPLGSSSETGHNFTYVRTIAPTSSRTGLEVGSCKCGKIETRVVDKVAESDYTYELLPADSKSKYGYVRFNGVNYPIDILEDLRKPTFSKKRTIIAEISKEERSFDWLNFIAGFSLTDDFNDFGDIGAYGSGGFVILTDLLGQIANNIETSYFSISISEAVDGTDYRATIAIGDSNYENNVNYLGTGIEISLYHLASDVGSSLVSSRAASFYKFATGEEPEDWTLYTVIIVLDPARKGSKFTKTLSVNSDGELVPHPIPYTNDKMYIGKVTHLGLWYEKLIDVSYYCNPYDERFIMPLF